MSTMDLVNCDVCNADFAVRVTLTRHIKIDRECNCNVFYEENMNDHTSLGITFSKANTYTPYHERILDLGAGP